MRRNMTKAAGGGGTVTPADLPNLVRWYKADGTLYTDDAGTDPVDTNGDPVGYIGDESLNNRPLLQNNLSAKPVWQSSTPSIYFDGTKYLKDLTHAEVGSSKDCVIFFILKNNNPITSSRYIMNWGDSGSNYMWWDVSASTIGMRNQAISSKTFFDVGIPISEIGIRAIRINGSTGLIEVWKYASGVLVKSPNTFIAPQSATYTGFNFGGVSIPITNPSTSNLPCDLYEFYSANTLLAVDGIKEQCQYLATKWGVL